ncbi:hypothetical protein HYFRA_00007561 [Hymenoscyphus fraxineus]|uniref:Ankyrin n=1 Tax=Hymenoscyphus fraxineus TaxID=746836 RepID=A0A9N9KTX0_9HELO|nr:hypothetical protein HYFRA_00007561 [Hymenoscyphus fraxineus]
MSTPPPKNPRRRPAQLLIEACKADDLSIFLEALPLAPSKQDFISSTVTKSIRKNATKILSYALDHGGEVPTNGYFPTEADVAPSTEILEILLSHGWDINARTIGDTPFLWYAVYFSHELVAWCLDHGATATPKDLHLETREDRMKDEFGCPSILEKAAANATVKTFELLRSKGAKVGRRTLHFAAAATYKSRVSDEYSQNTTEEKFSQRLAMVKHLIETIGIDPNALDQPAGYSLGNHWGTPLCYVAKRLASPKWDTEDVVSYLLSKGADPEMTMDPFGFSARSFATDANNQQMLKLFDDWKASRTGDGGV